jgi:hypothetical protein
MVVEAPPPSAVKVRPGLTLAVSMFCATIVEMPRPTPGTVLTT